jgi:hypothetical protein
MKNVTICKNPLEPETWEEYDVPSVCELLAREFDVLPSTAKIYHGYVCEQNDVTPACESDIDRMEAMPGPFYVVVLPEDYVTAAYVIIAIVAAVVITAVVMHNMQQTPGNQTNPSPNNDLADRQNRARPFARIPDIYGTVRSTPDLLMMPYSEYINNVEYEHAYMCIGRGTFRILDARDDTTPITNIEGAGVTVYGPGDSPNVTGLGPFPGRWTFGEIYADPVVSVGRMTSVNGQDLLTDNTDESIGSVDTMVFSMEPDPATDATITFTGGEDLSGVTPGSTIYLYCKSYKTHHETHDTYLSGNYVVRSCDSTSIVLANVQSVAVDWGWLQDWGPGEFFVTECHIVTQGVLQVGPFLLPQPAQTQVWCNLVATNGLYQIDDSGNVSTVDVDVKVTIQPTDTTGNATGDPYTLTHTLNGDAKKNTVAITWKITLTTPGPCLITMIRTSTSPVNTQVIDGVKWKDLLSMTPVAQTHFGDVTTVYSVTKATSGALSVKERKLNLLVQRQLPAHLGGNTFGALTPTNSVADAICAASLDPLIGNRDVTELDINGIYTTAAAVAGYFGTAEAAWFNGTLDNDNMSYEEIVQMMAGAAFCTAYRQGSQLKLYFEQETTDSTLLFGHRNKVPGSEKRTVTFGSSADYDSVEFTYTHPVDDSRVVLYVPTQGINAQKIDSVGVRSYAQAYLMAWRAWNKIKYTNTQVEFEAMQEAALLLLHDRIIVADNTRSTSQDGEVVATNVLEYQLSQKPQFIAGHSYTMFLQGIDGALDAIPVIPGSNAFNVVLSRAPIVSISTDPNASVRPLYWIVANDDVRPSAFLVTKREPAGPFTERVSAVNYDDRYYANDDDVILGTMPADPHL